MGKIGQIPWNKGLKGFNPSPETQFKKGSVPWNKKIWRSCIDCGKESRWIKAQERCHKCWLISWENKSNHPRWKKDRSKIKIGDRNLHDPLYKEWHREVKNRDGWKCKIANGDCSGRLEAHHILAWRSHPELRYEINNGITLCHFHHPRTRAKEVELSPYFQSMVLKGN